MPPEQAKGTAAVLAEGLTNTVATAADIDTVHGEIRQAETRLRSEIQGVEARLRTEIAELRAEVRGWLITQAFAIVGALAAIVGLAAVLSRLIH